MQVNLTFRPFDLKRSEHGEIGADVCSVRIQQGAIPIKENATRGKLGEFHGEAIVSERGLADK